jgi:hypothetical protein
MPSPIRLLAIESSCDETSAAILEDGNVLSNVIYTQSVHEKYGGVVPEEASRLHIKHIVPVVEEAFQQSGISKHDINAVAYTMPRPNWIIARWWWIRKILCTSNGHTHDCRQSYASPRIVKPDC